MAGEDSSIIFSRHKNHYIMSTAAGDVPESDIIHKATYKHPTTGEEVAVGIKIFDLCKIEDVYSFITQLHEVEVLDHKNLMKVHCTFMDHDNLWVIMSPPGFSVKSIVRSSLSEDMVAFILKETLEALNYMHGKDKLLHENMKAGCISLDEKFKVKVTYNPLLSSINVVQNEILFLPEIRAYYRMKTDKATDILMFGLLALELFYGRIPVSGFEEFQLLVESEILGKEENQLGFCQKLGFLSCFRGERKKKIPEELREVIAACLVAAPEGRPTANQLMEYELFQKKFTGDRSPEKLMKKARKYIADSDYY